MNMKAVILEDEKLIAKELQFKIAKAASDIKILEVLPSITTAKKWLTDNPEPDLIFADVQLLDGISFELFNQIDVKCPVIFTTAYDDYAIKAFKVNGVDYLLKPIDLEELKKAIDKCRAIIDSKSPYPKEIQLLLNSISNPGEALPKYKQKFIVNFKKQWVPVSVADISCFVRDNLNYIYTFSGDKYLLDFATLEEIEELLDPKIFYRANRQCIVHLDAIKSVKPQENSKLILTLKAPLNMQQDISREKAPSFKAWFDR